MNKRKLTVVSVFTLIELMLVAAIIAVLLTLLLPALGTARERSKQIFCVNNMKQLFVHTLSYTNDNNGYPYPVFTHAYGDDGYNSSWLTIIYREMIDSNGPMYSESLKSEKKAYGASLNDLDQGGMFLCPNRQGEEYSYGINTSKRDYYNPFKRCDGDGAFDMGTYKRISAIAPDTLLYCDITCASLPSFATQTSILDPDLPIEPNGPFTSGGGEGFYNWNRHETDRCNFFFFDGHGEGRKWGDVTQKTLTYAKD